MLGAQVFMFPEQLIPVPKALARMRRFPLDGKLLLFDRETGMNALCEGPETKALRQRAPRVVQFGITNRCNLTCGFCSRDLSAESRWTADSAFAMLAGLAAHGVLEVAFGGGEPWAFAGFAPLLRRLYEQTPLAVSLTTNGLLLTPQRLAAIEGAYGQIRLSLYEDNDWPSRVAMLAAAGARFGVNWLLSPQRLPQLEATVLRLAALGCRDVLLLSYNGRDASLHLSTEQAADVAGRVKLLGQALRGRLLLKLDVCWGERMEPVPRLFARADCGAGREFIVLTSDQKLQPCSFHHLALPVRDADEVMTLWRERQLEMGTAAHDPGCARAPGYGLSH